MTRYIRSIAIATTLALALGAALAQAASKPKSKGSYYSQNPYVEIAVSKSLKSVMLYVNCSSSGTSYWYSPPIPLRHGAFSYDKPALVDASTGPPTTTTVLFTGQFKNGEFRGKVHIAGSACPEKSYTTRYSTGGGGSTG